ncbi:MAG: hypothetical protein AB7L66_05600 [Gemmatimonadales bacterium]
MKTFTCGWVVALSVLGACSPGPAFRVGPDAALADTLKARIVAAYDFSRPDVLERMEALYPDTGRVLSAGGGVLVTSVDSLRAGIASFWANAGRNMQDARWIWGEAYAERYGPNDGVLTAAWSIPHIAPTGRPHVLSGVWTAVFRRIDGRWMIIAEHLSMPPA